MSSWLLKRGPRATGEGSAFLQGPSVWIWCTYELISFADRDLVLGRKRARGKEGGRKGRGGKEKEGGSFKVLLVLQAKASW